jgi:hypothetical protein
VLVNALTGRAVYTVRTRNVFQSFGAPPGSPPPPPTSLRPAAPATPAAAPAPRGSR